METPKAIFIAKDSMEAKLLSKAEDMGLFIFKLSNLRRKYEKYTDYTEEQYTVVEDIFKDISEELNMLNINIEDIIC